MAENKHGVKIDSIMSKVLSSGKDWKGETSEDKIGGYAEAPGGGTPLKKGEKAPSAAWVKEHRQMQPRNPDGTFGYNSQNGKDLKYGPSRGVTVPHFLRGIKLEFMEKGAVWTEGSKELETYILSIDLTKENVITLCKEYKSHEGGFLGAYQDIMEKKKGRKSADEKTAIASGNAGPVKDSQGNIKHVDLNKMSPNTKQALDAKENAAVQKYGIAPHGKSPVSPTPAPAAVKPTPAPAQQNYNKQPVTVGAGAPAAPQYKAANFQGKNISSGKMGRIANLFGNIMKK